MMRCVLHRLAIAGLLLVNGAAPAAHEPWQLGDGDRLLVLAPHPDDEILAAGGLIQEALGLDLPMRVCFFTMGDNHEIAGLFTRRHPAITPGAMRSMGPLRQNEAIAAATQLGLSTNDLVFLGYPDYGSLVIWNRHWRTVKPYRSMLTRASAVPYERAHTPGSAHAGEDILEDLEEVIRDFQPTHLVVSHPADHNVDHRALYLFTRVALWRLESEGLAPELFAAPVHFTHWPKPRTPQPERPATPPREFDGQMDWVEYVLAPFQVAGKLNALRRHHSQYQAAAPYLNAFVRKSELFGDFPDLFLPNGSGTLRIEEDDSTQFRPDPDLFQELARESDQWNAIGEQHAAEMAQLGEADNDFMGRIISGDGTNLTLSFQFLKPLAPSVRLAVAVFGFRADTPFGEMPKISIEAKAAELLAIRDLDARLPQESIEKIPGPEDEITLRIPDALLGNPEKILTGAMLWQGRLPVDWVAWRAIELPETPALPPLAPAARPPAAAAHPPPPPTVPQTAPASLPTGTLRPRVNLPRKAVPDRTEANEPVVW